MLAQIWEGATMVPARVGQGVSGLLTRTSPVGLIATGVAAKEQKNANPAPIVSPAEND